MKIKKPMGKRGSLQDLILVIAVLLTTAITIIVAVLVANEIDQSGIFFDRTDGPDLSQTRDIYNQTLVNVIPQFDKIFVGTFIAGMLGAVLLAFAVRSITAFFIIGFIFTVIIVMVSAIISNVYDEIADNSLLVEYSQDFVAVEFIMSNLPLLITVAAVGISVVLYGLWRVGI